jgi:hypothetical protein
LSFRLSKIAIDGQAEERRKATTIYIERYCPTRRNMVEYQLTLPFPAAIAVE